MYKYNEIKKQLEFGTIKKAVFGTYDATQQENGLLSYINTEILDILAPHEVDFDDIVQACNGWELDEVSDFDDFVWNDKIFDNVEITEKDNGNNSYNWNCSTTFFYQPIEINGSDYIAVRFHRYGDVRGNYTDTMLLEMDIHDFSVLLFDETYKFYSFEYLSQDETPYHITLSMDIFKECNVFDIDIDGNSVEYDVYIDIDDDNDEQEIYNKVVELLKDKGYLED